MLLCQICDINSISTGNALAQTGATHNHAQLELPGKGNTIKGLVVCYAVWLVSMKGASLRCICLVPCCGQDGYQDQVKQHPIDTYRMLPSISEKKNFS